MSNEATSKIQTAHNRQIRVFISSTFRDMIEERDHLVKYVFPELRRLCESRGVVWGEVDLRWGVTDEQAAEGKVLPICLEEIKRCRPYFIGMLGERYGWIPEAILPELIEREPWLGEQLRKRKSVTEFEIMQGVLNNPKMAGHAYFYFRSSDYLGKVPDEKKKDYTSENAEAAEKLKKLKEAIREASDEKICYLRDEEYKEPKQLGEWIREDFIRLIDKLYPDGSQPNPLDREEIDHEDYAQSRKRVYVGKKEYFDSLDAHATCIGNQPLVILGEPGSGKSALLANWLAAYRKANPDIITLQHYIGATPDSTDCVSMLKRIMGELKRKLEIQEDIPDNPDALRSAFPNWLHMAAARVHEEDGENQVTDERGKKPGDACEFCCTDVMKLKKIHDFSFANAFSDRKAVKSKGSFNRDTQTENSVSFLMPSKIIIVLDALNQLEDRDGAPDLLWLPSVIPENVRLIVSTLPGRSLDEIRKRNWPIFNVEPLSLDERRKLIVYYLAQHTKSLNTSRVDRIANAVQSANPLYLRVLLDELRLIVRHEDLEECINYYLKAHSAYELYEKVIARWEQDYGYNTKLVSDTLSFLWAARRGLSEAELLDILGSNGQPLPRAVWSPLFLAISDGLVRRSGCLNFAHDFLRTAIRDTYLPSESARSKIHLQLAEYFEKQPPVPRRTDELPWQLAEAKEWKSLQKLLTDRSFFTDAWKLNQFEVKTYWTQIEAGSSFRMVGAYHPQVESPDSESDKNYLLFLSSLLADTGHLEEALALRTTLVEYFKSNGDINSLQMSIGNQAVIFQARGDFDRAMTLHKEQEHICRRLGNLDGLSKSLGNQAAILQTRGDLNSAMVLNKEMEQICRKLNNMPGLQVSLGNQALILQTRGDLGGAMVLYKEKERICRQLGNLASLQSMLCNRAVILCVHGDLDGAMALNKEAERICRQLGNLSGLQVILGNQAVILQRRCKLDGAMLLHREKERICRQLGDMSGLQASLGNQALILQTRGDFNGAMTLHKEQERICRQLGNLDGLRSTFNNQALILKARGDLNGAMALHKEQERICRQLGNLHGLSESLGNQALILERRRDLDGAMSLQREKERICRQLGELSGLQASFCNQANILSVQGNLEGAMSLYKEAERICHQLCDSSGLQTNLFNQALILHKQNDLEGAMSLYKEVERICRQLGNLPGLQATLGSQAAILKIRGNLDKAMLLFKEQEMLCRKLENKDGLWRSLYNQVNLLFYNRNDPLKALPLCEEAIQILRETGIAQDSLKNAQIMLEEIKAKL